MLIAHLSDLHFGYQHFNYTDSQGRNQRELDFERSALACAEYLTKGDIKPDIAIVAGDLLHKTTPSLTGLDGASKFCQIFKEASIPLLAIGGNHDEAEAVGRFNGLRYLSDHYSLLLHLDFDHFDFQEIRFHCASFRQLSRSLRRGKALDDFDFAPGKKNVLISHGYAPGKGIPTIPPDGDVMIPSEWLSDSRFDLICLGHIHTRVQLNERAFFAGSTERRNFGEVSQDPGFWLHQLDDNTLSSKEVLVKDIDPSLPREMIVREFDCRKLTVEELQEAVNEEIDKYAPHGAILKVVLEAASADLDRARLRSLWERRFREGGGLALDIATKTRAIKELMDIQFAGPPLDLNEAFQNWLSTQVFADDEERESVLSLGSEIMAEAYQDLIVQESG